MDLKERQEKSEMVSKPLVSIIMPLFNSERFVLQAVDSVISQKYPMWELLIIDDASTDSSLSMLEKYKADERITVITLKENSGSPVKPRNLGIKHANGQLIAFIDSDDVWLPEKLNMQVEQLMKTGAHIVCSGYWVIDEKGQRIGQFRVPEKVTYSDLLRHNTIGCLTAMYDSSVIGKNYFPECGHEDYALWLKILSDHDWVHGVNQPLAEYRIRSNSISSNKLKNLSFFWHIYRHRERFSIIKSVIRCFIYFTNAIGKYRL